MHTPAAIKARHAFDRRSRSSRCPLTDGPFGIGSRFSSFPALVSVPIFKTRRLLIHKRNLITSWYSCTEV